MKIVIGLIAYIFCSTITYAQKIPMGNITEHLIKCGETPLGDSDIAFQKWFDVGDQSLYSFSTKSIHHYNFILLRRDDSFQIFNCFDFLEEYKSMNNWFINSANNEFHNYLASIIELYEHNQNFHPNPPISPGYKNKSGEFIKPKYTPRKLVQTNMFIYK